ncbi:Sec-independent protein translocase protein TatB [Caulobacter segnis]|jgi:sec-independent protein translocase protein TatB|uniref:Sec-independent protein translocase protein TatB n=1 Tax=Caulobacter segnis TaxID=88688 RepID=UPI001CBD6245|nr:Sec-independent protein translocase protein TatB [Caulobacter segnis]UAL12152.1 Sec-independent protein translocase protein TatB [Caulobacter segnis]
MLPDIGGTELLVIAAVALIVVGPKDLPVLLRKLGQFVARMRGMASEFRASFDEMARQSELDELRREVQAMRSGQFANPVQEAADAAKDVGVDQVFADIDASLSSGATQMHPYAGGEIHNPALTTDNSILPPVDTAPEPKAEIVEKPKRAPRKKTVAAAEPTLVEPAKAPRKKAAGNKDITVETPKAKPAPRKRAAKAGSTASDIVS